MNVETRKVFKKDKRRWIKKDKRRWIKKRKKYNTRLSTCA